MGFLSVLILSSLPFVISLIGFDCGGQHLNVTTVSLLEAGDCNLNIPKPNSTEVYVQLLQLSDYNYVEVIQCKVEIMRTIHHCGMHSHVSLVSGGLSEYILEISQARCQLMFEEGILRVGNAGDVIDRIRPNSTTSRGVTLAGTLRPDGTCQGTQYSDPFGTWDNAVVQALVRITLKNSFVPTKLGTGKVILKSGTICALSDGYCLDSEDGYTFWKPMPTSSCNFDQYDVLYEGSGQRISDSGLTDSPTIFRIVTEETTFALTRTKEQPVCGYTLLRTEHPKLFILETKKGDTFANRGSIPVNNLDIFTYVNSKFVYVEKHIQGQLNSLYYNVMQQRCELEREVITNTLSFATLQPDEFAYRLMKGPGYMAVTAGEAVHVVKCIPVEALVRKTEKCYYELPVTIRNTSLFLTPKSRILTKVGTERDCSHEFPTLYRFDDTWIQLTPHAHLQQLTPQQLNPLTTLTWKYLTPGHLAVSGIYSASDLERIKENIMFPAEKPALLNTMARGMTGHSISDNPVSIYNLLDEDTLKKIAESTASRIWGGFIQFGSATAGIMGVFLIIRIIKLLIDTIIHGYALHSAYGCTIYLLGAIWSSITHLLLHLARGPPKKSDNLTTAADQTIPFQVTPSNELTTPKNTTHHASAQFANVVTTQPIIYRDLDARLHDLERIPTKPSESVLK